MKYTSLPVLFIFIMQDFKDPPRSHFIWLKYCQKDVKTKWFINQYLKDPQVLKNQYSSWGSSLYKDMNWFKMCNEPLTYTARKIILPHQYIFLNQKHWPTTIIKIMQYCFPKWIKLYWLKKFIKNLLSVDICR